MPLKQPKRLCLGRWVVSASVLGACAGAPNVALADDGPLRALENMGNASPTITAVTVGSVLTANLSFTLIGLRDAIRGQSSEDALYGVQLGMSGLQAVGFLAAPFAFDIDNWGEGETLLMLLPAQAFSAMLTTHAVWSLTSEPIDPASRLGVSALIGVNSAFTSIALGSLADERWAPFEVSIAEIAHSCLSISLSSERIANDSEHGGAWGAVLGWSIFGLAHGVGSFLVEMPGSRVSQVDDAPALGALEVAPFIKPFAGGLVVGLVGGEL